MKRLAIKFDSELKRGLLFFPIPSDCQRKGLFERSTSEIRAEAKSITIGLIADYKKLKSFFAD